MTTFIGIVRNVSAAVGDGRAWTLAIEAIGQEGSVLSLEADPSLFGDMEPTVGSELVIELLESLPMSVSVRIDGFEIEQESPGQMTFEISSRNDTISSSYMPFSR